MTTEFEVIERFIAPFRRTGAGVIVGPGDDCAVLRASAGADLCVTTDAVVEGVHFNPEWSSDADIGHKALAVNLSDLASMGAQPRWFLVSIACPTKDLPRIPAIAKGMARLAEKSGIVLAGGNFARADQLSLHITAAGETPRGKALRRDGARPGDRIFVTGNFGDAALALALHSIGRSAGGAAHRQLRPEPRLKVGLIARTFAHGAIDVSDGLLADLQHVSDASRAHLEIDALKVPVSRTFKDVAANLDVALTGGEDYELAIFVPAAKAAAFERACKRAGEPVTLIGEVSRGQGLSILNAPHLTTWGFDHFSGRPHEPAAARRARGRRSAN